jgi:pimeloyl-ACP methyl ester carboxylesterase
MKLNPANQLLEQSQPNKRRRLMTAMAGAPLLAGAINGAAHAKAGGSTPKTFVLIHGAWHGAWCWRDVRTMLEARGHRVFTPTLTGLGERHHLSSASVDLHTHIRDVAAVLECEELNDVVLVGHSYAGYIVNAVANTMPTRISAMVYLDALLPIAGKSAIAAWPPEQVAAIEKTLIDGYALQRVQNAVPRRTCRECSSHQKNPRNLHQMQRGETGWAKIFAGTSARRKDEYRHAENGAQCDDDGTEIVC